MKRLIAIGIFAALLILPFHSEAVVPQGQTFYTWFDKIVTDLTELSSKMRYFGQEWNNLSLADKNGLKVRISQSIDDAITKLTDLKNDLNAL